MLSTARRARPADATSPRESQTLEIRARNQRQFDVGYHGSVRSSLSMLSGVHCITHPRSTIGIISVPSLRRNGHCVVVMSSVTVPVHTERQHPPTPRHEGGAAGHLVRVARQEARKTHLAPARACQNIPARMPSQQPPPFTLESKPTRSAHRGVEGCECSSTCASARRRVTSASRLRDVRKPHVPVSRLCCTIHKG